MYCCVAMLMSVLMYYHVDLLMCWWLCWCVDVLMTLCWCIDVLMYCCVAMLMSVLMYCHVNLLMCRWLCWCVDDIVLMCWCVDLLMIVFMCWCVDVLMCWCVDVLMCWVEFGPLKVFFFQLPEPARKYFFHIVHVLMRWWLCWCVGVELLMCCVVWMRWDVKCYVLMRWRCAIAPCPSTSVNAWTNEHNLVNTVQSLNTSGPKYVSTSKQQKKKSLSTENSAKL